MRSLRFRLMLVIVGGLIAAGLAMADASPTRRCARSSIDRVDRTLAGSARMRLCRRWSATRARDPTDSRDGSVRRSPAPARDRRRLRSHPLAERWSASGTARAMRTTARPRRAPPPPGAGLDLSREASLHAAGAAGVEPGFRVRRSRSARGTSVVAAPLTDVSNTLRQSLIDRDARRAAVVAAGIVGAGLWLVRVGLRPLDTHRDTAAAIGAGDLAGAWTGSQSAHRGRPPRRGAERDARPDRVGLRRADRSEGRLRRFVGDASHEVRTPLSSVRRPTRSCSSAVHATVRRTWRGRWPDRARVGRMGAARRRSAAARGTGRGRPLARAAPVDLAPSSSARRSTPPGPRARRGWGWTPSRRGRRRPHAAAPGGRQPARQREGHTPRGSRRGSA